VRYAHACISQTLHEEKVNHVSRTQGNDVVRICSRTVPQLENLNAILKELLQHNYIEEIGMPLNYAYKMKSLVLFIKPFDARCSEFSEIITSKFKNSGLNFHITVFDVIYPHHANKKRNTQTPDDEPKIKIFKQLEAKATAKTPDDEPKIKQLEAKATDAVVVEEVQQQLKVIGKIRNATQKDKHPLWEIFRTLLLNISSGFVIFVTQIAAVECFIVIYFFQKKFLFPYLFEAKETDTMVEEVQQIEEIHNGRHKYKYPPWEVITTILLSMISGFVIFLKRIASQK